MPAVKVVVLRGRYLLSAFAVLFSREFGSSWFFSLFDKHFSG